MSADHADAGWDSYAERVVRNEGRLGGLERLVAETREADKNLIEQRSESLARELERRAESLLELVTARADAIKSLGEEERQADRRHVDTLTVEAEKRAQQALVLLREVYDTAIRQNYEQSREAIDALEQRRIAATDRVEQMVRQWRDSDTEARRLFAAELARHLDTLNHNNERMREFQNNSVTRELWQSEKDAAIAREGLLRDQIIALDKALLTMTPIAASDKTHALMMERMESEIASAAKVLSSRIEVVAEKVAELKTYRDTTSGKSSGYTAVYGWGIAAVTVLISVVLLANSFLGK